MTLLKPAAYIVAVTVLLVHGGAGPALALSCNMEHTYTTPQGTRCRKAQHPGTRIVRDCGGFDGTTCDHLNPVTEPCPPGTYNPDEWHTRWQCLAKEKTCADVSAGRYGRDEQAFPGYRHCVELAGSTAPEPACGPAPNQYLYKTQLQWMCLNVTCHMCSGPHSRQFATQCDSIQHYCTTTSISSNYKATASASSSPSSFITPLPSTPSTPSPTQYTLLPTQNASNNIKIGVIGGEGGGSGWSITGIAFGILIGVALGILIGVALTKVAAVSTVMDCSRRPKLTPDNGTKV